MSIFLTEVPKVRDLDQPKSAKDSFDSSRPECDAEPTQYTSIDKPRPSEIIQVLYLTFRPECFADAGTRTGTSSKRATRYTPPKALGLTQSL